MHRYHSVLIFYRTTHNFECEYFGGNTTRMALDFDSSLSLALNKYNPTLRLKDKQLLCLRYLNERRDVVVNLPTGYGKSAIYHLLPLTKTVEEFQRRLAPNSHTWQ